MFIFYLFWKIRLVLVDNIGKCWYGNVIWVLKMYVKVLYPKVLFPKVYHVLFIFKKLRSYRHHSPIKRVYWVESLEVEFSKRLFSLPYAFTSFINPKIFCFHHSRFPTFSILFGLLIISLFLNVIAVFFFACKALL